MHRDPLVRKDIIEKHLSNFRVEEIPSCFGSKPEGNESSWVKGCPSCEVRGNCCAATEDVNARIFARKAATRFVSQAPCPHCNGTGTQNIVDKKYPCRSCCGTGKAATPCPKCKNTSGEDWEQCKGNCPLPISPHYKRYILKTDERGPFIVDRTTGEAISLKTAIELLNTNEKKNQT